MPWSPGPGGGFSDDAEVRPWLPMADPALCNVADQAADPDSVLSFTRRAIARRRANEDLALGSYHPVVSPTHSWVFRRGHRSVVVLNMADTATEITGLAGSITLATERGLEGTTVEGPVTLAPWSGIVVES